MEEKIKIKHNPNMNGIHIDFDIHEVEADKNKWEIEVDKELNLVSIFPRK